MNAILSLHVFIMHIYLAFLHVQIQIIVAKCEQTILIFILIYWFNKLDYESLLLYWQQH